jgi:hypothetical protein
MLGHHRSPLLEKTIACQVATKDGKTKLGGNEATRLRIIKKVWKRFKDMFLYNLG